MARIEKLRALVLFNLSARLRYCSTCPLYLHCLRCVSFCLFAHLELLFTLPQAVVERQKRWLLQDFGLGALSGVTPYPDAETLEARKALAARNEVTLKAQAKGKEPPPVNTYVHAHHLVKLRVRVSFSALILV